MPRFAPRSPPCPPKMKFGTPYSFTSELRDPAGRFMPREAPAENGDAVAFAGAAGGAACGVMENA